MVGAFGEVQVMDWGLAKVLARVGPADEESARLDRDTSIVRTVRHRLGYRAVRRRDRCSARRLTWRRSRRAGNLAWSTNAPMSSVWVRSSARFLPGSPLTAAPTCGRRCGPRPGRLGPTWAMPWIVWTRVVPSRSWSPWRETASHPSGTTAPECRRSRLRADDLSPRHARTTQTSRAIERRFAGEGSTERRNGDGWRSHWRPRLWDCSRQPAAAAPG